MRRGGKYVKLYEHLLNADQGQIELTLANIERILGKPLPPSARTTASWWSNRQGGLQASSWLDAGYHVESVDLVNGNVMLAASSQHPRGSFPDDETRDGA